MYPKLLPLYGPFELNSYNASYIVGLTLFIYLAHKHPLSKQYFSTHAFINLCLEATLVGIAGGRLLHVLSSLDRYPTPLSIFQLWDGGLSILGGVIGIMLYLLWYSSSTGIPLLAITDLSTLYAPLFHAIGRVGCFLVGCCYGSATVHSLSVTYTHPDICAPRDIPLHPAQLYSAALYLLLFGILYLLNKRGEDRRGTITYWYFIGMSMERFAVELVRGDSIPVPGTPLTFYQWIALSICVTTIGAPLLLPRRTYESL